METSVVLPICQVTTTGTPLNEGQSAYSVARFRVPSYLRLPRCWRHSCGRGCWGRWRSCGVPCCSTRRWCRPQASGTPPSRWWLQPSPQGHSWTGWACGCTWECRHSITENTVLRKRKIRTKKCRKWRIRLRIKWENGKSLKNHMKIHMTSKKQLFNIKKNRRTGSVGSIPGWGGRRHKSPGVFHPCSWPAHGTPQTPCTGVHGWWSVPRGKGPPTHTLEWQHKIHIRSWWSFFHIKSLHSP